MEKLVNDGTKLDILLSVEVNPHISGRPIAINNNMCQQQQTVHISCPETKDILPLQGNISS